MAPPFLNSRPVANRLAQGLCPPAETHAVELQDGDGTIASQARRWGRFFLRGPAVSNDFMDERASMHPAGRDAL